MKTTLKLFIAVLMTGICSLGYGQTEPDYMKAPKSNEKIIGTVSISTKNFDNGLKPQQIYTRLLDKAKKEYPGFVIDIRDMTYQQTKRVPLKVGYDFYYEAVGKVVDLHDPQAQTYGSLSNALDKALRNVREGSRMAIDEVRVTGVMDKETLKDQIIDVLLDNGYKVVAKEYLEKLYDEQQTQQSGIYNDKTIVQENNFSAVGYYINVKVTETSLRVQVVNVSTGEYEGNATITF